MNLKLRRTRIFVMFDHVNSGFMGYDYYHDSNIPNEYQDVTLWPRMDFL